MAGMPEAARGRPMSDELKRLLDERKKEKNPYPHAKSIRNWVILIIDIVVVWGIVAWYWVETNKDLDRTIETLPYVRRR